MSRFSPALPNLFVLLLVGLIAVSCAHTATLPLPATPIRNPLVFMHGIMGARLENNGKILWGVLELGEAEAEDLRLPLVVPSSLEPENRPETEAKAIQWAEAQLGLTGKCAWLYFFYQPTSIYGLLLKSLVDMGFAFDVDEGTGGVGFAGGFNIGFGCDSATATATTRSTLLSFSYDWRQDNAINARRLGEFLAEKRDEITKATQKEIEDLRDNGTPDDLELASKLQAWLKDFKFDVIAHSMGGLIARYFLYYGDQELGEGDHWPEFDWRGAQQIDNLILVGTPNLGSPKAFKILTSGYEEIPLRFYSSAIVGTFPSVYQLLPQWYKDDRGAVLVDLFKVETWKKNNWGIVNSDEKNIKSLRSPNSKKDTEIGLLNKAETYLSWCLRRAKRFHEALNKTPAEMRAQPDTKTFLVVGKGEKTWTEIYVEHKDGRMQPLWEEKRQTRQGDGTVPEKSALAGQNLPAATTIGPLEAEHTELTWHPEFLQKLREILVVPECVKSSETPFC